MDEIAGKDSESANLPRSGGPKKKRSKRLAWIILVIVLILGARGFGFWQAYRYGRGVTNVFIVLGTRGMSDTGKLRGALAEPEFVFCTRSVRMLLPLTIDYKWRMDDLQAGMIYYSEQFALPPEKRFLTPPPRLKFLKVNLPADQSNEAFDDAVISLLKQYRAGL